MVARHKIIEEQAAEVAALAFEQVDSTRAVDDGNLPEQPEPDPQSDLGAEWNDMSEAPINRAIFITSDPTDDPSGVLSYWRTTREKISGRKGWHTKSYWAAVLTKRALDFEPYCWREAVPGIALEAAKAA